MAFCKQIDCIDLAVSGGLYCEKHKATPTTETFRYTDPLLNERGKTHGNSVEQFATAQALKEILRKGPNWAHMTPQMREALEMDATKSSRIVHGDPWHIDAWDDKAGYAKLVAETLRAEQDAKLPLGQGGTTFGR